MKVIVISLSEEEPYSVEWVSLHFAESKPEGNNQNEILDITIKSSKILDLIYNQDLLKLEQSKPINIGSE